jgi:hypothetical protein
MEYPFMVKSVANRPNGVTRTDGVGYPVRRIYNKVILLLTGLFFTFLPARGQLSGSAPVEQSSLYPYQEMSAGFSCRVMYTQGSGAIAPWLGSNAAELEKLDQFVRQALSHPTLPVFRLRLTGYSSIEGSYARNESLARERVAGLYIYLRERYPELYRYSHDRAWVAEDWDSLTRLIRESPLNNREEVLAVIRRNPVYDTRESLLTTLDGGYPWLFMEREVFPQLRRAEVHIEASPQPYSPTASPQPSPKEREPDAYTIHTATTQPIVGSKQTATASPQPSPTNGRRESKEREKEVTLFNQSEVSPNSLSFGEGRGEAVVDRVSDSRALFTLKTNLLLLAGVQPDFTYTTPVLNGALEYYINDHWSVEAGAAYSYWQYRSRREFQGVSGYRLEPRYRLAFPGDRFGAYLGAYGRFGDYDIRKTKISVDRGNPVDDNYEGQPAAGSERPSTFSFTGRYWDAGLSAGFTVKIVGGLGLEVGARAGYVRSSPKEYIYRDGQKWFDSHWKYHRMGVTDLNLSITYTIR